MAVVVTHHLSSHACREASMNDNNRQRIQRYLQDEEVQARIREQIERGREEATVTIGRAASLYGFRESKIRELEAEGLLNPMRNDSKGQRQYSLQELDKLAIIRELLDAKYSTGEIQRDIIDRTWEAIFAGDKEPVLVERPRSSNDSNELLNQPIDQRIDQEKTLVFWRYYAPNILRVALMLINELLPNAAIGLVVPLSPRGDDIAVEGIDDLSNIGEALIGWLEKSGTSHTLFTTKPSFQYPTDYSLYPLLAMEDERPQERQIDNIMIVLERPDKRSKLLTLPPSHVRLIRRLLFPLRETASTIRVAFGLGMRNERLSASDISAMGREQDIILEGLADMIIRLGGKTASGENLWRFCTILLPDTTISSLPFHQRSLVTRAQSKDGPYIIGESVLSPLKLKTSLGIRAFQSGRVIYRPRLSIKDTTPLLMKLEGSVSSNIAVPVGSEHGQTVAVVYVASDEPEAFPTEDQQLLRVLGRLVENSRKLYTSRLQETKDIHAIMLTPDVVDGLFADFLSENDFMRDIEEILSNMSEEAGDQWNSMEDGQTLDPEDSEELTASDNVVSFVGLDLDNQESLASRYGDEIMRQISKAMGLRIQEIVASLVTRSTNCQMYYMFANRYYLILKGISLSKSRMIAEQLRTSLEGNISLKQSDVSDSVLIVPDISVHLAISSYPLTKLRQFLKIYLTIADISSKISQELDYVLKTGTDEHGNVVMSFDYETKRFMRWSPVNI